MTKVTLPRTNQTGDNEWSDVEANDQAIAAVINGELDNENLKSNAGITRAKLAADGQGVQGNWYTPKIIATEETRTNAVLGTMPTADEVSGVALPANGLIAIAYAALWKASVTTEARAAIFLNGNQLKVSTSSGPAEQVAVSKPGTSFGDLVTSGGGLIAGPTGASVAQATTGQLIGTELAAGGFCLVFANAGTYNVSVRYAASSGSVTAKNRKLWVAVLGI